MKMVAFFLVRRLENPIAEVTGVSVCSHFCVYSCTGKSSLFILNKCSLHLIKKHRGREKPLFNSVTRLYLFMCSTFATFIEQHSDALQFYGIQLFIFAVQQKKMYVQERFFFVFFFYKETIIIVQC